MADVLIFASSLNFADLEAEKNMGSGGKDTICFTHYWPFYVLPYTVLLHMELVVTILWHKMMQIQLLAHHGMAPLALSAST